MKKSITKNYIYNLCYQIVIIISPLIVAPYISRILGAAGIGAFSYTQSIVSYFKLFASIGISLYAQIEIAYVQNDIEKRSQLFWEIIQIRLITTLVSVVIYLCFFMTQGDYKVFYLIQLIDVTAVIFDITWFFQGIEDFKKVAGRNIIIKIIEVILTFSFIKSEHDLWIYILFCSITSLVGGLSLWTFIKSRIIVVKRNLLVLSKHWKPIILLFIPQMATQVYTVLDKTILGSIINVKEENGYYEQAQKLIRAVLMIITAFGMVMMSRIAKEVAANKKDRVIEYIYNSFQFVLFLAFPFTILLFVMSDIFVPWFFGSSFSKVIVILKIMSPAIIFVGISNVIGMQYLLPLKRNKEFTYTVASAAFINVILNFILVPNLKSIGTAIAYVISELTVVILQVYYIRKEINIMIIFRKCLNYFISSIVMCFSILVFKCFYKSMIINMIIITIIGCFTYMLVLFVMKDSSINFIKESIRKQRNNKHD